MPSMPWAEMLTAWAVFAGNILSPGPNVFNTIAIALGSGRRVALAVVPAIALGVLVWATLALVGAAVAFRQLPWLPLALAALGGTLLLVFARRYARAAWYWGASTAEGRLMTPRNAFLLTLGVLAANPKALTTWLVLVGIFPAGEATTAAIAVMVLGCVVVASAGHAVYALAFSTRAAAAAYARAGRWITAGVALFFATLGITLWVRVIASFGIA
ncbi:MAG: LysE family transporter [Pseudomonadota bacterium]